MYRVQVEEESVGTKAPSPSTEAAVVNIRALSRNVNTFTDDVHVFPMQGKRGQDFEEEGNLEIISQAIKDAKQKILLEIVDKFEVPRCDILL